LWQQKYGSVVLTVESTTKVHCWISMLGTMVHTRTQPTKPIEMFRNPAFKTTGNPGLMLRFDTRALKKCGAGMKLRLLKLSIEEHDVR